MLFIPRSCLLIVFTLKCIKPKTREGTEKFTLNGPFQKKKKCNSELLNWFYCINPWEYSPFTVKKKKKSHIMQWFAVLPTATPEPTDFQRENREVRITPMSNGQLKGRTINIFCLPLCSDLERNNWASNYLSDVCKVCLAVNSIFPKSKNLSLEVECLHCHKQTEQAVNYFRSEAK